MGRIYTTPINLKLEGRIPSKKNSKQIGIINNKPRIFSSKNYKIWQQEQSWKIARFRPSIPVEKCEIVLSFFAPDKRSADLTNKAESVMDLLVDNAFLKDDNWFVVTELTLKFAGVFREKPGVKIEIKPYENNN